MKLLSKVAYFFLIFLLVIPTYSVSAQDVVSSGPTYTIQPGDTLNVIAIKFGVSVDDIILANNITNPHILSAGQQIVIPGLEGVTGNLTAEEIPLGANLSNLSVQYQFPIDMLIKLNKVTSPREIYAGSSLILPVSDQITLNGIQSIKSGGTLFETAISIGSNPWILATQNNLQTTWSATPSTPIFYSQEKQAGDAKSARSKIPFLSSLQFNELPVIQGHTIEISATGEQGLLISGSLLDKPLHFFQQSDGRYTALQGIHAMAETGLSPFEMSITRPDGSKYQFSQMIYVQSGYYPEDPPLSVDPETIDPSYTKAEDDTIKQIITPVSPIKLWTGIFREPVDEPVCTKSIFGVRRIYNGGQFTSYHGGLDFGVCANLNIYAPAAGTVVFTGPLTATGNATFIDHGQGIYTGYGHQAEIKVKAGDHVEPGQLIGIIGATGRVTGPHLHFEVWVNGVKVNPVQWLEIYIP
jgi:murein DD-endopeptidase MepM/ murein hydrolase activator NlpD